MIKNLSGILLAGGKSKRMGEDKAFLHYRNKELYTYPLEILEHFCDEILISSANILFSKTSYEIYADETPDLGPMGGLLTCLKNIQNEYALVLSCDTPGLNINCVSELLEQINGQNIMVGLNSEKRPEPLVGIYKKDCLSSIETLVDSKIYKMSELLKLENTNYHSFSCSDSQLDQIFFNVNTKDDFKRLNQNGE